MAKPNAVSAKHAAQFEGFIRKWQRALNLGDWRVNVSPVRCKTNMAELYKSDLQQRLASIRVGESFGPAIPVTASNLEKTALHELLHVFFLPLIQTAQDPKAQQADVESLEHALINVLETLLVEGPPK